MIKPKVYSSSKPKTGNQRFIDVFKGGQKELFLILNPKIKPGSPDFERKLKSFIKKTQNSCCYIYFPQEKLVIKSLKEKDYFKLRTARNREIITEQEQQNFRNLHVGIAGLSVGSAILHALVVSGGPKHIRIADFDNLEITNLNRIRAGIADIGLNKTDIAAREVYKLDPFAELVLYPKGLSEKNLEKFLLKPKKLDVFIDEMDDLALKLEARLICKQHRIPVIMATDMGDTALLDIERYDLEPNRKLFHGFIKNIAARKLKNLSYAEWLKIANKIIGHSRLTERMKISLGLIGKKIIGVPQLGTTAQITGGATSLILRRMASGQKIASGRYKIPLESALKI